MGHVVVRLKTGGESRNLALFEINHQVNVPRHPRLSVVVHGHRAGQHVGDSHLLQPGRDIVKDVEFIHSHADSIPLDETWGALCIFGAALSQVVDLFCRD